MATKLKISFLIPAHNEENIIATPLRALERIADERVEVLVGLDGCTDGTKTIVEEFPFVKHVELNERGGKPAVLAKLVDVARGEILIVHDADWQFECTRDGLDALINDFADPHLGAIVLAPHNLPFLLDRKKVRSRPFLDNGIALHWFSEFLVERQTRKTPEGLYVDADEVIFPFTLNVFRKGEISHAKTVADDLERFVLLLDAGNKIKVYNDPSLPYFFITNQSFSMREHYRRRVRGHIARAQLRRATGHSSSGGKLYLEFLKYSLRNLRRIGLEDFRRIISWMTIIGASLVEARLKIIAGLPTTKKLWESRDKRQTCDV